MSVQELAEALGVDVDRVVAWERAGGDLDILSSAVRLAQGTAAKPRLAQLLRAEDDVKETP